MKNEDSNGRKDYISWESYFMFVAFLSALRSKDPSTRHGACIVNKKNVIVGVGYNGFPIGCSDEDLPWDREGDYAETKAPYVVHAELNAILNAQGDLDGCKLYLYSEKGYYPCCECAKAIIQSGISEVVMAYATVSDTDVYSWEPTNRMFNLSGVKGTLIDFDKWESDYELLFQTAERNRKNIDEKIVEGSIVTDVNQK